ncbi:MAG: hypothetical protein K2N34_04985 [Lachnospiraceae bacterium]|nr:hypothetical protein [Lachnospiraceae bacterium]
MKQFYFILFILLILISSCSSSSKGDQADDKSTEQVTAVVDSLISTESDMKLVSLSVVKAPMPSFMADEVQPAIKQSAEMMAAYIFSKALTGDKNSDSKDEFREAVIAMGAPLREAMKKYEDENHPDFVFGLANVVNTKDTTQKERRLFVFEENDLKNAKRIEKFSKKNMSDVGMIIALAYGDQIDVENKDLKLEEVEFIKNNPILKFIVEE